MKGWIVGGKDQRRLVVKRNFCTANVIGKFLLSISSWSRLIPNNNMSNCFFWVIFWNFGRSCSIVSNTRWHLQCVAGHCYYQLSLFFLFSFSVFCFWPTSGKLPRLKICFPQYFGITRRYLQNKYCFYNFTSYWPFLKQKV